MPTKLTVQISGLRFFFFFEEGELSRNVNLELRKETNNFFFETIKRGNKFIPFFEVFFFFVPIHTHGSVADD